MKSLKDFFFEDEDKFVSIEYKTTTDDDVTLSDPINSPNNEPEVVDPNDVLPGGANLKLVGELRLYSETSNIFNERKRKIANKFKSILKDEEVTANRIKFTKIFDFYINHLIDYYKKNVSNVTVNVTTKEELKRQLSSDIVMIIRNQEIFPKI